MDIRWKLDGKLDRSVVDNRTQLQPCHGTALPFVGLKHEIAIDDHPHRKPWPDRQCRLNVEVLLNHFLPGLIEAIAGPTTKRGDDVTIAAGPRGRSKFAANAEQG